LPLKKYFETVTRLGHGKIRWTTDGKNQGGCDLAAAKETDNEDGFWEKDGRWTWRLARVSPQNDKTVICRSSKVHLVHV